VAQPVSPPFTASDDTTVQVREVYSGDLVCEPIAHETFAMTVDFSPDGQRLLTASFKNAAHQWDLRPGGAFPATLRDREPVRVVAFIPPPNCLPTTSATLTNNTGTVQHTVTPVPRQPQLFFRARQVR
jgi:WD40 repeat protein